MCDSTTRVCVCCAVRVRALFLSIFTSKNWLQVCGVGHNVSFYRRPLLFFVIFQTRGSPGFGHRSGRHVQSTSRGISVSSGQRLICLVHAGTHVVPSHSHFSSRLQGVFLKTLKSAHWPVVVVVRRLAAF